MVILYSVNNIGFFNDIVNFVCTFEFLHTIFIIIIYLNKCMMYVYE